MFDVGFGELVLLFMIGLLVLGPQRLPKVAAELGKWVARARRTATQLRRQLEHEVELSEITRPPPSPPPKPTAPQPPPADHGPPAAAESSAPPTGSTATPADSATTPTDSAVTPTDSAAPPAHEPADKPQHV
jgi:sec-independent protein translocase protein TatB